MMDIERLTGLLWPHVDDSAAPRVFALLDGARDEAIAPAIWRSNLRFQCLYAGKLCHSLQLAAPYLVQLASDSSFYTMLVEQGWARAWGVFVVAEPDVAFKSLRDHFRAMLRVKGEKNRVLLFRFYDPRVLRIYLPTCTASELSVFFGPVRAFACENTVGNDLIRYERSKFPFCDLIPGVQEPGHACPDCNVNIGRSN